MDEGNNINKQKTKRKYSVNARRSEKELKRKRNETINRLPKIFFEVPAIILAQKLLGKIFIRKIENELLKGRIVETECYPGGEDKASATYNNRRTQATEPLYMAPGTAFVYMTYGMYHCMNISSLDDGGGVLIRALEPIQGIEYMHKLRLDKRKSSKDIPEYDLCSGPSKLCISMKIEKGTCNKVDFITSDLMWIENSKKQDIQIVKTSRIGINSAGKEALQKPYRFYIFGNKCVSKIDKIKEQELLEAV